MVLVTENGSVNLIADKPLISKMRVIGLRNLPVDGVISPKDEKERGELFDYFKRKYDLEREDVQDVVCYIEESNLIV